MFNITKTQRNAGFTLLESLIVLSIFITLAAIASSAYHNFISNQRLETAANQIYADLKLARSEAIKQNKTLFVSFVSGATQWCYGINENTTCDCTENGACLVKGVERNTSASEFEGIQLQSANFAGGGSSTAFGHKRGFAVGNGVKNGTIWLKARNGAQVAIIISRVGRIRFCSIDLTGYPKNCPTPPA